MTMNCVSKNEGHREIIQGCQNFKMNGQKDRLTDRHGATNSEYGSPTLLYLSRTV
jgi:hypothetical protein